MKISWRRSHRVILNLTSTGWLNLCTRSRRKRFLRPPITTESKARGDEGWVCRPRRSIVATARCRFPLPTITQLPLPRRRFSITLSRLPIGPGTNMVPGPFSTSLRVGSPMLGRLSFRPCSRKVSNWPRINSATMFSRNFSRGETKSRKNVFLKWWSSTFLNFHKTAMVVGWYRRQYNSWGTNRDSKVRWWPYYSHSVYTWSRT